VSKWFKLACARLGICHIAAKPFSAKTKGKLEKYNQTVDQFLNEFALEPVKSKTLAELNRKFYIWMDEGYTHAPHDALKTERRDPHTGELLHKRERTPYQAYTEDPAKVRYVSSLECREAFLWEEQRTADKTGCVKLAGIVFDVGAALARRRVDLRYDPFDLSIIDVWHGGAFQRKAEALCIEESCNTRECAPAASASKPTHSRLLRVYEERNKNREKQRNGALDFHSKMKPDGVSGEARA